MQRGNIDTLSRSLDVVKIMSNMGLTDINAQHALLNDALKDIPDGVDFDTVRDAVISTYSSSLISDKITMTLTPSYNLYLSDEEEGKYLRSRGISFEVSKTFYLYILQCMSANVVEHRRTDSFPKEFLQACLHHYKLVGSISKMVTDNSLIISQVIKCLLDIVCTGEEEPEEAVDKIMTFLNTEVLK